MVESKKKSFGGQGIAEPEKFAVKLMATVHKYTNERTGNIDLHIQAPQSAGAGFEREIKEALATDRLEEEIKGPYKNGELRVRVKRPEVYHILIDCLKETTLGYKLEVLEPQKGLPAWKRPEIVLEFKTDAGTLFNERILKLSGDVFNLQFFVKQCGFAWRKIVQPYDMPTVDEKKAKEPCDWLLIEQDYDINMIHEDLANLCDKYGWYFNDTTRPKVPPVPVSNASGKRRARG